MLKLNFEELSKLSPEEQRKKIDEFYATLSQEDVLVLFFSLLKHEKVRKVAKEIYSEEEWAKIENIL